MQGANERRVPLAQQDARKWESQMARWKWEADKTDAAFLLSLEAQFGLERKFGFEVGRLSYSKLNKIMPVLQVSFQKCLEGVEKLHTSLGRL